MQRLGLETTSLDETGFPLIAGINYGLINSSAIADVHGMTYILKTCSIVVK